MTTKKSQNDQQEQSFGLTISPTGQLCLDRSFIEKNKITKEVLMSIFDGENRDIIDKFFSEYEETDNINLNSDMIKLDGSKRSFCG